MCTCVYMCVHVCTCVYMCVHVRTCTYMYVHVRTCTYMCVHVCTCVYMCVHVCTCVYMCVHVCTCVYMCVHVCTCVYMCVHVHVHVSQLSDLVCCMRQIPLRSLCTYVRMFSSEVVVYGIVDEDSCIYAKSCDTWAIYKVIDNESRCAVC